MASAIVGMMPPHTHYVEPFFGSGAVLFNKPIELVDGHSEVVNDLYSDLVVFWRVLASTGDFPKFKRRAESTPLSKTAWQESLAHSSRSNVDRAIAFFTRYRQSRQGLGRDFATLSKRRVRRGMNEQASAWLSAVDGLEDAHRRLRRVAIFQDDAIDVIGREDSTETLFYCDPPYMADTRVAPEAYTCEMSTAQHVELLGVLGAVEGNFILSGYRNGTYDAAAKKYGWNRKDIPIDNKASGRRSKPKKVESLWTNY